MATIHRVEQGECLSNIATKYGFTNWRTIYDDPQNRDFKRKRPNPNLIFPGDQIVIPDKQPEQVSVPTGKRHTFKVKSHPTWLRIVLQDEHGQPLAGRRYQLRVQDKTYEDTTGEQALVEHVIHADADEAVLTVWPYESGSAAGFTWTLKIGHLDPVEEISGIQARLTALGFPCGPVDGICGDWTKAAVRTFQEKHGLVVDGVPGPRTQNRLIELHGC